MILICGSGNNQWDKLSFFDTTVTQIYDCDGSLEATVGVGKFKAVVECA